MSHTVILMTYNRLRLGSHSTELANVIRDCLKYVLSIAHKLMFQRTCVKQKAYPGTTCFMTIPPNLSGYTETRCHWTAQRLAYSLGSSLSNGLRLLRIPPVPTDNSVTVLPLLSFFCNGICPTSPTTIAYKSPPPQSKPKIHQSAKSSISKTKMDVKNKKKKKRKGKTKTNAMIQREWTYLINAHVEAILKGPIVDNALWLWIEVLWWRRLPR